ncbi:MAG: ArsA-related P-loop ATPase, partial [Planctomycetota bacterium]
VVLDTAPTGHTIRLLELPEVIQQWLGEILSVLVHYEDVVSLPRVNEKLISLSRGLKKLRALLADQQASRLVAVTIPTHLAVAETERLMAGCQRLGVNFAGLIVNQVTPTGSDELSATINNREAIEVQRLVTAANGTPVAQVQRTTPPRGIDALAALGDALTANTTVRDAA